jgi:Spy/CpxP family protein refolding chaperone
MRKLFGGVAVALAAVLGVVGLTAFAGGCGHHGPPRDPAQMAAFVNARVDDALDDLDATPAQRTQIHGIVDKLLASAQQARAGHDEARAAVVAQWKSDAPDRKALHDLVDARIEVLRKVAHDAVDAGVDAHGVLTPAQREKVAKKADRWHR